MLEEPGEDAYVVIGEGGDGGNGLLRPTGGMTDREACGWIQKKSMDRGMRMRAFAKETLDSKPLRGQSGGTGPGGGETAGTEVTGQPSTGSAGSGPERGEQD